MQGTAANRSAGRVIGLYSPEQHRGSIERLRAAFRHDQVLLKPGGTDTRMPEEYLRRHHHAGLERHVVPKIAVRIRLPLADRNATGDKIRSEPMPQQWHFQLRVVKVAVSAGNLAAEYA